MSKELEDERAAHAKTLDRVQALAEVIADNKIEREALQLAIGELDTAKLHVEGERDGAYKTIDSLEQQMAAARRELREERGAAEQRDAAVRRADAADVAANDLRAALEYANAERVRLQTSAEDLDRQLTNARISLGNLANENAKLRAAPGFVPTHYYQPDDRRQPVPYQRMGQALPAGIAKQMLCGVEVYRNAEGALYFRSAEDFSQKMKPVPADWIEHDGSDPKLPHNTQIEYVRRGYDDPHRSHSHLVRWNHLGGLGDILRYRVVE